LCVLVVVLTSFSPNQTTTNLKLLDSVAEEVEAPNL